jgi:hypothetical protein
MNTCGCRFSPDPKYDHGHHQSCNKCWKKHKGCHVLDCDWQVPKKRLREDESVITNKIQKVHQEVRQDFKRMEAWGCHIGTTPYEMHTFSFNTSQKYPVYGHPIVGRRSLSIPDDVIVGDVIYRKAVLLQSDTPTIIQAIIPSIIAPTSMILCEDWKQSMSEKRQFKIVFDVEQNSMKGLKYTPGKIVIRVESAYDEALARKNGKNDNFSRKWIQTDIKTFLANVCWPVQYLSFHECHLVDQPIKIFVDLDDFQGDYLKMIDTFQELFIPFFKQTTKQDICIKDCNWTESTKTLDGQVVKNSLHMTLSRFKMSSVTQVKSLMIAFVECIVALKLTNNTYACELLKDGILDFQVYASNKSLRVIGSAKLNEPHRPVRPILHHHSGQYIDSYVTFIQDDDIMLADIVQSKKTGFNYMFEEIISDYMKDNIQYDIEKINIDEVHDTRATVVLKGHTYCHRKGGHHSVASKIFYRLDLLTNEMIQSCHSAKCALQPVFKYTHEAGFFGQLFASETLDQKEIVSIYYNRFNPIMEDKTNSITPEILLHTLSTCKSEKEQCNVISKFKKDTQYQKDHFTGTFMDAITPFLNRFWGKTEFSEKPIVIRPYRNESLTGAECDIETMQTVDHFETTYKHFKIGIGRKQSIAKLWANHLDCRMYKSIQFYPKINTRYDIYNTFKGFSIEPNPDMIFDLADIEPVLYHLRHIWAQDNIPLYDYILNWFTHVYIKPWVRTGVALVVKGARGSGKGTIMEILSHIVGQNHYWRIDKLKDLTGEFTAPKRGTCILGFADECYYGGDPREANALKSTITEKDIMCNVKNIPQYSIESYINIVIAANGDNERIIPAANGERRYQLLESSDEYAGAATLQNAKYFEAIRNVDPRKFAAFLARRDISKYNPRMIIETEELRTQQILNMNPLTKWWMNSLEKGYIFDNSCYNEGSDWPNEAVPIERIISSLRSWADTNRIYRGIPDNNKAFMLQFRQLIGKDESDNRTQIKYLGKRVSGLILPDKAKCKANFNLFMKTSIFTVDTI